MWAAIGLYGGQEDNRFFRRTETSLTTSGCRQLHEGDVALLGDDTIHSVHNPRSSFAGAIHVYGGDLPGRTDRTEWDGDRECLSTSTLRCVVSTRPTPRWQRAHRKLDTSCSRIDTER